jgi:hypothetical protein
MRLARMRRAVSHDDLDPLIEAVKDTCDEDAIGDLIRDLADALNLRRPLFSERRFFLDWGQVREMAAAGIEIGSHGCSHRILTRVKSEEAEEEMIRSKVEVEARIAQAVQHFAFPYGAANADLMALVGKAGYRTASLCRAAPDGRRKELFALRRLGMHEGVAAADDGSFSGTSLLLWLLRAPRTRIRPGLHR